MHRITGLCRVWLWSPLTLASATEELNFSFYFITDNINLNSYVWVGTTILVRAYSYSSFPKKSWVWCIASRSAVVPSIWATKREENVSECNSSSLFSILSSKYSSSTETRSHSHLFGGIPVQAEKNGLIMLTVDCVKTICEKITHDLYIETGIECNKRELMLITKVSGFPFPPISWIRNMLIFPFSILNKLQIGFSQLKLFHRPYFV